KPPKGYSRCVLAASSFTILSETPCADPHAGVVGNGGVDTSGYPINCFAAHTKDFPVLECTTI
ncbi:MAG: hypothetical protein MI864_23145, partial [Pseudomonadales bacterium]|nr:hypothetical protein [Pseudomonadales bacterium]